MSSKSFFLEHLEELATTLTENSSFSQEFLQNQQKAIVRYNTEIAPGEPLKVSVEEIQLLSTLQVENLADLLHLLRIIATEGVQQLPVRNFY